MVWIQQARVEVLKFGILLTVPLRSALVVSACRVIRNDQTGDYLEIYLDPRPPGVPGVGLAPGAAKMLKAAPAAPDPHKNGHLR